MCHVTLFGSLCRTSLASHCEEVANTWRLARICESRALALLPSLHAHSLRVAWT